jgi:spore maturation protein CgeB/SAM-dependent methyltransferase
MSVDILDRVYDAYAGELGQHFMRETQRRIHWMCSSVTGSWVLDVGCSQGLVPILLGREGKSVVGIDCSAAAIRTARERLVAEPLDVRKRVTFVEGDFATHRFEAPSFDCLLMGEVLEHLLQPERFIEAAANSLTVGGRLVVTVPFGVNDHIDHKHTFYLLEPYRLLAQHFDIVEVCLLGKWLGLIGVRQAGDAAPAPNAWRDDQLAQLERAFEQVERQLVDGANGLRAKLEEANTKYRASTEDVARLKREVAHHDAERKVAERALKEATPPTVVKEAHVATQHGDELHNERELRHTREVALARLEERLQHASELRELELEQRDAVIKNLAGGRAALEAQLRDLEQALLRERNAAAAQRVELDAATGSVADLQARLSATQLEHDGSTKQARERERLQLAELERLELELSSRSAEATQLSRELTRAHERLQELSQSHLDAARQLETTRAALFARETELALAATTRADLQAQLTKNGAEQRNQALLVQKQSFERVLETQRNLIRAAESQAEQLKAELTASRKNELRVKLQLDTERRERANAERRAVQTRNTLSFQLGYELIHGFKSRGRLLALPKQLWQLQQEATRRRRERASKHRVPLRPLRTELRADQPKPGPNSPSLAAPVATPARAVAAPLANTSTREKALPAAPTDLKQARVACVLDEFTFASFAPECELLQVTPDRWQVELEAFAPQLLFIESAWRGKDELWNRKIAHRSQELQAIVEWCKSQRVPTAFWNKEDPVHYRTFLNTAKLFDIVFTTDIDCIPRYKRALGHERVYLLPFAVQPKAHGPHEKYSRKDRIAFAGAYYARYPERQADLASFVEHFSTSPGIEIFDRNHGKSDPDYQFPERYAPHIVGTLAFDEIDKAYKGYRYALNLNSIKGSQTMFARRVFELLGSNTITVSNFSRGVRLMFGDLVITTDHGGRAAAKLGRLQADDSVSRRFRLAGLRKVLQEHTYSERLRFISARVWGQAPQQRSADCVRARSRVDPAPGRARLG